MRSVVVMVGKRWASDCAQCPMDDDHAHAGAEWAKHTPRVMVTIIARGAELTSVFIMMSRGFIYPGVTRE